MGEFMSDFEGFRPLEFFKVWKNFDRIDPLAWLVLAMGFFVVLGLAFESLKIIALIGGFILFVFISSIAVGVWRGIIKK